MANEKKKSAPHDLQQTNGLFTLCGIVSGTDKENFYKEAKTKNDKPFRSVTFGVEFDKDKKEYVSLNGMQRDQVVFTKRETVNGQTKSVTEKVNWKDRFTFKKEGYSLLGVHLGLTKTTDNNGKEVNEKKVAVEFDACNEIGTHLKDGSSVFVRGKIEFSTYQDKHYTKFVPQQISLCSKDIDFEDEKFESNARFTQTIIFMGIEKSADTEGKFIISGKVIGYNSIEDVEFVTYNSKLAKTLKKALKPYNAIEIYGNISVTSNAEEVEEDDEWGESNKMERNNSPFVRELVVTGANKDSIDKTLYSEESVETAIAKLNAKANAEKEFDSGDDWGSVNTDSGSDDDDEWG